MAGTSLEVRWLGKASTEVSATLAVAPAAGVGAPGSGAGVRIVVVVRGGVIVQSTSIRSPGRNGTELLRPMMSVDRGDTRPPIVAPRRAERRVSRVRVAL